MVTTPLLAHSFVPPLETVPPSRWVFFLHGILGRGSNLSTLAHRVVASSPGWGVVLVDMRLHGGSQGFPSPHTLQQAAGDLMALEAVVPGPVAGVLGHSFGGKVALEYARQRHEALDIAWVLDAMPGVRTAGLPEVMRIFEVLERIQGEQFPSRALFCAALAQYGLDTAQAHWLAMNVVRESSGVRFGLDLPALRTLLEDALVHDLWPMLEQPPGAGVFHVAIGGRSPLFQEESWDRVMRAQESNPERVRVHLLPEAGHWVHVDALEVLADLVGQSLQQSLPPKGSQWI